MKKLKAQMLQAVLAVPLSFSSIDPINVEFVGDVETKIKGESIIISSEKGAGGPIFPLPEPLPLSDMNMELTWEWAIQQYSKAQPEFPLKKETDDYPLRVGLLISDGEFRIPLKWYVKMKMKSKGLTLSYMIFYCAAKKAEASCAMSPVTENTLNCLLPSSTDIKKVQVQPTMDLAKYFKFSPEKIKKMKILGVWVFADSDNVPSKSSALLKNFSYSQKKTK